ncbi:MULTISPECIES: Hsp33 family molecular chaperone HslO [Fusobacterium]|uniref:Hsp33 family molecular chaperone HslO n=1 Tax=Fusobacterium TaxID=848 RepID=UPI0008A49A21|nr:MULTISPECIES: Hsp33 family molecular chaperone HslO [Fusobacterium]MCF0170922.1 Hsp33 family molecular chaperone HslO [Fusobacterium varium]MCF2671908.1 Hsp33 family molecular chaperone HslO [Fusobacterium varium]MCI6031442.1 Hsp33 family molecular chaperone HslO [Fusobacterium varium]OFL83376.1 molecular chaperone Hsp33 [Fusobacterium sp. HMSC073F01]RGJ32041.1 Hsp33 family molecular chaperone HslO [Fusobacterium varium]
MSKIIRGVSKNARFFLVDSTNIVQEALDIHKCSPTAIDAFGRLLTAGVMMGSTLKGKDLLTLRTDTDGPLDNMVVTADSDGGVKGYVSNPSADVVLTDNGKSNVGALIGKGMLRIIKDMGLKEPYVGMSPIDSGEIAQDLAYYFFNSDQTPTVIALGVKLKDEKTVACAGGYMIQLLPGAEECFIGALEEKIQAIRPMTELMMGGMDLKRILKLLYEDMSSEDNEKLIEEYEILEEKEVSYKCNCDKDKFYRGLITLGKKELNEIFETQKFLETECHFCGKKYKFTKEDFKEILEVK